MSNTEKMLEKTEKVRTDGVIPKMINEVINDENRYFPCRKRKWSQSDAFFWALQQFIAIRQSVCSFFFFKKSRRCLRSSNLTRSELRHGIILRHGINPRNISSKCASNKDFTVTHALYCPNGGYTQISQTQWSRRHICWSTELYQLRCHHSAKSTDVTVKDHWRRSEVRYQSEWSSRNAMQWDLFRCQRSDAAGKMPPEMPETLVQLSRAIEKVDVRGALTGKGKSFKCTVGNGMLGRRRPMCNAGNDWIAAKLRGKIEELIPNALTYFRTKISFALLRMQEESQDPASL